MSKQAETQKPLLPKLRFPEFKYARKWTRVPLGEIGEIITGKTPSTKESDLWNGDILFITPTDISEEDKYLHDTARTVVKTKNMMVLPVGSIVYTCIASIGKIVLTVRPSITNQQINVVVPNERALEEFIYYALVNLTPWIKTIPASSTLPIINKTEFSKIRIILPGDKTEQQKIAECLSTLDERIGAESRKLEALKTHKKGLMQQLFPREGETRPRLRFPEFQNAPEWEIKTVANACNLQAGRFVRASEIKEQPINELFPCYGGNGLRGYTSTYTHDGTFPLIGRQGALCGNVKFCSGMFHATEHALVASPKKRIDVGWLYYSLDSLNLNRFATGQAQPGLSVDVLAKVALAIPRQESEQHRIASCLSSRDNLIAAQTNKLETLKTHKKGLMQQLFPTIKEEIQ